MASQIGPVKIQVGHERLQGSSSNPANSFNTPLATLHTFNGWADKFLVTPGGGLVDVYLALGGKIEDTKLTAVFHDFHADDFATDSRKAWLWYETRF